MPGTASCFTRRFGRKKLCSTSMLFRLTSTLFADRHVQIVDVEQIVLAVPQILFPSASPG